jgi:hypothetical protein
MGGKSAFGNKTSHPELVYMDWGAYDETVWKEKG